MRNILRAAFTLRIVRSALKVSLVVGTILNFVNQGGPILAGARIDWFHLVLNYFVPYCASSYSATKNEITGSGE